MKFYKRVSFCYLLALFCMSTLQTTGKSGNEARNHKLKILVKEKKFRQKYWYQADLISKDTLISWQINGRSKLGLANLPGGEYKLILYSVFGDSMEYNVNLGSRRRTVVKAPVDEFYSQSTITTPLVDQMKAGDVLVVYRRQTQLNTEKADRIFFHKRDSGFQAALKVPGLGTSETVLPLSYSFFVDIEHLELTGRRLKPYGCNMKEDYALMLNRKIIEFTDGTCLWHGFDKLKAKILFVNTRH